MIITKSKSTLVTVLIHVLVWGVLGVIYSAQPLNLNIVVPYQLWIKQSIMFGLLVIAYYLNAQVLVPRFLLKNNTIIYFLIVIGFATTVVLLSGYIDRWLNLHQLLDAAFHKAGPPQHHKHNPNHDWDIFIITVIALVLGISTSVTAIQKWQKDKQLHQEMAQDKISSELSFLKAQINPHFFFNTLNNIYALTLVNADTSRKAIHQLSKIMRYVLYDTQNSTTLLSQEIAFIKDYISLMQLRLTDVVKIEFTAPVLLKDVAVPPMIFLSFVENAFKHGVSATSPSNIHIAIEQDAAGITLNVANTIIKEQNNNLEEGSGIGLNNTRRRLDLLYPDKYSLVINDNAAENTYTVHLTLNLA